MCSRDEVIKDILSYVERNLQVPKKSWTIKHFRERVYMRAAAFELIEEIMDKPNMPVEDILYYKAAECERQANMMLPPTVSLVVSSKLIIFQMFWEKYGGETNNGLVC